VSAEDAVITDLQDQIDTLLEAFFVKKIFVTKDKVVGGNLGGLAGADRLCAKLAHLAGLKGWYMAWLSDSTGASPSTRFTRIGTHYELPDDTGTLIAEGYDDLVDGALENPIDVDQNGDPITAFDDGIVYTSTLANGTPKSGGTCGDWSDTTKTASHGDYDRTDSNWSFDIGPTGGFTLINCNVSVGRLYCVQQ
jgi:hypothetical protein